MKYIKKNIWLAFYTIVLCGFIFLGVILYSVYKDMYHDTQIDQENITKITTNSIKSLFHHYEIILNILEKELLQNERYKNTKVSQEILNNLSLGDDAISGSALISPNGKIYLVDSINMPTINNFPNLLEKKDTKESFEKTLNSNSIVVGRTYYNAAMGKLIIPIRKAIKNKDNKTLFVVSIAIIIEKGLPFLNKGKELDPKFTTFIYRDSDRYLQIAPKDKHNKEIYQYQFPREVVNRDIQRVEKLYKMRIEKIKDLEIITTLENDNMEDRALLSSLFIKKLDLWIVTKTQLSYIINDFYKISFIICFIFLLVCILIFWLFKIIDKSEERKKQQLEFQATHDYLTNLENRLYLDQNFKELNKNKPFHLFFIDMDNFKSINDNYSHELGDRVLIELSKRLVSLKEKNDVVIRYSGDEFLIIKYNLNEKALEEVSNKILNKISQPYEILNYSLHLTASIGISSYPNDGNTIYDIKRYADIALYEAKNEKNRYTIFNEKIKQKYLEYINLEHKMKTAFNENEFHMVYQPQICNSGNICGIEALVRWENKELGNIRPDIFIPIAETSNQMEKLGEFILNTSLKEIQELQKQMNLNITLSINISVKQFMQQDFTNSLLETIKKSGFDKSKLQLEITESIFIEDVEHIIDILNRLKKEGIKISLDDFGTGYSSLSLLKKLPIDELKIDKSFIDDILQEENSLTMVESIIDIAKKMKMVIVAEGIEELEQKTLLQEKGCNLYQGYYFSKPLKIEDLKKYITR